MAVIACPETKLTHDQGARLTIPGMLLAKLTAPQLAAAETIGELREFGKGEFIFQEGDAGDCMYVVLRGSVEITKTTEPGRSQRLSKFGVGDFFGEMSVVDELPRSAHALALEATTLRLLRRDDLDQLLIINPQITFNLLKGVSGRLRAMNTQFIEQIVRKEKLTLVGQMANSILHDVRNPLTIIRSQAEVLGREERLTARTNVILRNVDRIKVMANDLLDFSRGGVAALSRQPVAPDAWLNEVMSLLKPMVEGRNIALLSEVLTQDLMHIDPDRLTRAIYNLAVNAIQAMRGEGVLTIRIAHDQPDFEIMVIDNGPGIPAEIRDRLFDPFVTAGKRGGTGLGTSIAKKIIEDHGGRISFQTEAGTGTTFQIWIPGPAKN